MRVDPKVANLLQRAEEQFRFSSYAQARALAQRALELAPRSASACHMLAAIAFAEGNLDESKRMFERAVAFDPSAAHLRYHLGNVLRLRGEFEHSVASLRRALKLDPGYEMAYLVLGAALRGLGRSAEAVESLRRYVERRPNDADAHHEMANAYRDLGSFEQSLDEVRIALRIDPGHMPARKGLAGLLLLQDRFAEGWPVWLQTFTNKKLLLPDPGTRGDAFRDKRVVVYGNEGVGDEVMFASCIPDLTHYAREVAIHSEARLVPLFARSFPGVQVRAMTKQGTRLTVGQIAPDELHLLTNYLPAYLRFGLESFPKRASYLIPDPAKVDEWRRRFEALGAGVKVGLSWRGGLDPVKRAQRSIPLAYWAPVVRGLDAHFVCLQYGEAAVEIDQLRRACGVKLHRWNDADPLLDLDSFAAQIAALDLVVSVDNSTVHLAGALGTRVWALLPASADWRWRLNCEDTPWYPSMTLVRQHEHARWEEVLKKVRVMLASFTSVQSASSRDPTPTEPA